MRYEYDQDKEQRYNNYYDELGNDYGMSSNSTRRTRKNKNNKKNPFPTVVASALVFGLVAGGTMYGVNLSASKLQSAQNSSAETSAEASANDSTATTNTASGLTTAADGSRETSASLATATTNTSGDLTVEQVSAKAMPSLVTISTMTVQEMRSYFGGTQSYTVEGAGTGVIIDEDDENYYIATNNHVISGATSLSVGFVDESAAAATIIGADTENDLAVVAVSKADLTEDTKSAIAVVEIGSSDDLNLGQQVVAIGNALGYGQSVTSGYVSALDRELSMSDGTTTYNSQNLIQTDAAINSGNSGGALLDMQGRLIGINEAKSSTTSSGATVDNMGYAIPIDKALPILQAMISGEYTSNTSATEESSTITEQSLQDQLNEAYEYYFSRR